MVGTARNLEDPEHGAERRTASLAALAVALALIVAGLYVIDQLRAAAAWQDCAAAGDAGCLIVATAR